MTRLLWAAALAVAIPVLVWADSPSGIPLENGRYRVIATITKCGDALCAVVMPKGREEKTLALAPSSWDVSLRSIVGLRTVLTGRVLEMRLTLDAPPRLFREKVDHIASPPAPYERL